MTNDLFMHINKLDIVVVTFTNGEMLIGKRTESDSPDKILLNEPLELFFVEDSDDLMIQRNPLYDSFEPLEIYTRNVAWVKTAPFTAKKSYFDYHTILTLKKLEITVETKTGNPLNNKLSDNHDRWLN